MDPEFSEELYIPGDTGPCSYLPGQTLQMEYRVVTGLTGLTAERYEQLLERGWRRFGRTLFRPQCPNCRECVGLRINIAEFRPSKSQRRAQRRNADLEVEIGPPQVTQEHIDLYNIYHEDMSRRRDWRPNRISPEDYFQSFVAGRF